VTLGTASMRPRPPAAGFQPCRPGSVSRAAKLGSSAIASRDILRIMPLAVTDVTNSRREMLIVLRLSLSERPLLRMMLSLIARSRATTRFVYKARTMRSERRCPSCLDQSRPAP
jgi:hypothetical protein